MTSISKAHSRGVILLIMTALVWGTSFPLLKGALSDLSPATLLAVRFTFAALAFSPWLREVNGQLVRDGITLGLLYFAETGVALLGLKTISANHSAFIVSLYVIFVPLLGVLLGRRLSGRLLLSAGVALLGIGILSWEGGGLTQGDWMTLGCAIGIAVYMLRLEVVAPRHAPLPLTAVQLLMMALLSVFWAVPQFAGEVTAIANHFSTLVYLGLLVTAAPIWTQATAQRWVPAQEAALLYALEPVFATLLSFWLLGEQLGIRGTVGAGLVLIATLSSQLQRSTPELQ